MTDQPPSALWAQAFASTYLELSGGEGDEHALLDWAYDLYPAAGQRPAAEVAREEFERAKG